MLDRLAERLAAQGNRDDPRERFLANVIGEPSAELLTLIESPGRQACVLMPIVERPAGPTMLFTERAAHLTHHPGQVAFPGGRVEPDDPSPEAAALREAQEEIGLEPQQVELAGSLGPHITGTGFLVTPVVGLVRPDFSPRADEAEVAAVFEVPLGFLLDPTNRRTRYRERYETRFVTYEYLYEEWRIWGATAAMVRSLQLALGE